MSISTCLALIVFFESRGEPVLTQQYVASVAIERAKQENVSVCESMRKPRSYSWYWDKHSNRVDRKSLKQFEVLAVKELRNPTLKGRSFFNERKMGKRFRTPNKPLVSGNLVFY